MHLGGGSACRLRHRVAALGLVLVGLVVAGCTGHPSAISPQNRPTTIEGARNGALPAAVLLTQGPSCRVYTQAAGSLVGMLAAAHRDGVTLAPEECYRDYAGQVYWSRYWCAHGLSTYAASPVS
jgi:hypothetical protein